MPPPREPDPTFGMARGSKESSAIAHAVRIRSVKALSLILLAGLATVGFAQEKEVAKKYSDLQVATKAKNVAKLKSMWKETSHSTFQLITSSGQKITGAQMLAQMEQQMNMFGKFTTYVIKLSPIKKTPSTYVVRATSTFAMDLPMNKKISKIAGSSVSTDTWVKDGAKWKLKEIRVTKETTTLDGKPISR